MDRKFRKMTFAHLVKQAGMVSDLVSKSLGTPASNFKEEFLKLPPGAAREALVYNEAIKRGPPTKLVPITVEGPNGLKLTYNVMPDYITIDGLRVSMAPATAQKIADHFGMKLPTDTISKQIYQAADTKVRAAPLSGQGYQGADGKFYSGKDVVENRIGQSDANVFYSHLTDEAIKKQQLQNGKAPNLIAGHMKDILQPTDNPDDVRMGGWRGQDEKDIQPYTNNHRGGAKSHSEYGLGARMMSNNVTVTYPDGRTETTTMDKLFPAKKYST